MRAHLLVLLIAFWHSAFMVGAISGLIPAALIDYQAFKNFQSWHDAAIYGWGKACFRWVQGALIGGLAGTVFRGFVG